MTIQYPLFSLAFGVALALAGCTGDDTGGATAGGTTAGNAMTDTGGNMTMNMTGGGMTSGGMTDTGTTGAGMTDTGTPDTGMPDTGMTDTGMTDTGTTGVVGTLPFRISFPGYEQFHDGLPIHIKLFDDADNELYSIDTMVMVALAISTQDIVNDGSDYTVRWWVDANGSSACDAPADDHSWELTGQTADAGGLTIEHMHDGNWTDVCSFW